MTGWAYAENGTGAVGETDDVEDDDVIYAQWEVVEYTVAYTLNGGTNNGANPATFDITDLPITLEAATKALNTFGGWFATVGFTGDAITTISTIGNKALFAKFTAD